ncbi:hypothetical protein HD554DRAFT_267075 [Boletus coccyginus]|nr:hypothetical protein HD554DRAFT_267075 [Boletus coccyginus]
MRRARLVVVVVVPFALKAFWIALETVWCGRFAARLIRLVWTYRRSVPRVLFTIRRSRRVCFGSGRRVVRVTARFSSLPLELNAREFVLWFGGLVWAASVLDHSCVVALHLSPLADRRRVSTRRSPR